MIRKNVFALVLTLLVSVMTMYTAKAQMSSDKIIGIWELEDKTSKMEVYKEGNTYYGKLLFGKDVMNEDGTSKKDIHNPNLELRENNIIGSTYITNLKFTGKEWEEGKVYDSTTGKLWNCYVKIKDEDLHFTGYWGAKWLGTTYVYKRIK